MPIMPERNTAQPAAMGGAEGYANSAGKNE